MAAGKKNTAFIFPVSLGTYSDPRLIKTTPTLAAGDVTISGEGGTFNNIGTLPSESPAGSGQLLVTVTAAENNYDYIAIKFHDPTVPPEWTDTMVVFLNYANGIDDLALAATALSTAVWTNTKAGYIDVAISSRQSLGGGSTSTTITINDNGGNPLDGVDVWVSTDAPGVNIVARGFTNTAGNVTFMLDAGTYYVWKQLSGYSFANPQTMTV